MKAARTRKVKSKASKHPAAEAFTEIGERLMVFDSVAKELGERMRKKWEDILRRTPKEYRDYAEEWQRKHTQELIAKALKEEADAVTKEKGGDTTKRKSEAKAAAFRSEFQRVVSDSACQKWRQDAQIMEVFKRLKKLKIIKRMPKTPRTGYAYLHPTTATAKA